MKKPILIASFIIIIFLLAEAYRENVSMEWHRYQSQYRQKLLSLAKTPQEKMIAGQYQIKFRQVVLPELNRYDRCISCHVGLEDPRMAKMPQPLKTHPGNYLEVHELERIGCTICHDGQGRAITSEDAKAFTHDKYWEKPLLMKPFLEANCYRCHKQRLSQTPHYNQGAELFAEHGCLGCHRINKKGGTMGPDLSNLGNANFYVKSPALKNRKELLHKFHENVNLAFIYEAVKMPRAQPEDSQMIDAKLNEEQANNLTVYLKSLSTEIISPHAVVTEETPLPPDTLLKGKELFSQYCSSCHDPDGETLEGLPFGKDGPAILNDDFLRLVDRQQLVNTITKGRENGKMPAWGTGLTGREINWIVQFMESKRPSADPYKTIKSFLGSVEQGKTVFQERCNICHQPSSMGSIAKPLNHSAYLTNTNEKSFYETVIKGIPSKGMPSYGDLSHKELSGLLALFRHWRSGNELFKGQIKKLKGNKEQGKVLFNEHCVECHGAGGRGEAAPEIGSNEFINTINDGFIEATLATGRTPTMMGSMKDITGEEDDTITAQQITDVSAYLESETK